MFPKKQILKIIGLMSGTSLDGLDIVFVEFKINDKKWKYKILASECIDYDDKWKKMIANIPKFSAESFWQKHVELGHFFGKSTFDFMQRYNIFDEVDWVVSHGQTVFHKPQLGYTAQIGCGAAVSASAQKNVVCDLRSMDIALKGQGAPLVPVGEKFLFEDCSIFLNLGGISNISFHNHNTIRAFDISPANTLLNFFSKKMGFAFDEGGKMAKSGKLNNPLFNHWNNNSFYQIPIPKSLHTDYIIESFLSFFDFESISIADALNTAVEHIAYSIGESFKLVPNFDLTQKKMMITGGGALNDYLVSRIKHYVPVDVFLPSKETILYKEALIMAFLGGLRILNVPNCYQTITGALKNSIGGAIYIHNLDSK